MYEAAGASSQELADAQWSSPPAFVVWGLLDDVDREGLSAFVASAWLRRTRRRRAAIVVANCAAGIDRLNEWMWMNRRWSRLGRLYKGPQ